MPHRHSKVKETIVSTKVDDDDLDSDYCEEDYSDSEDEDIEYVDEQESDFPSRSSPPCNSLNLNHHRQLLLTQWFL